MRALANCVLLQNPPEKLVSPRLCPKQAAAQAPCKSSCHLQHVQAGIKLKARAGKHAWHPHMKNSLTCQLPSPCPARHLVISPTLFLPTHEMLDAKSSPAMTTLDLANPPSDRQSWLGPFPRADTPVGKSPALPELSPMLRHAGFSYPEHPSLETWHSGR